MHQQPNGADPGCGIGPDHLPSNLEHTRTDHQLLNHIDYMIDGCERIDE